jgi:hypothetical protein
MMISVVGLEDFQFLPYEQPDLNGTQDQIKLSNTSSWTYCGPTLSLNKEDLPQSYHTWHRATVNGASLTPLLLSFLAFTHEIFSGASISHYWVTIRATKATPDFDSPRWHTDDDFFLKANEQSKKHTQWKLATTLLGPGTLFIVDGQNAREIQREVKSRVEEESAEHACSITRCLGCAAMSDEVRSRLADALLKQKVVQAQNGDCCVFRTGSQQGAVHSEPPHHGDRVFINVVPGTEAELRDLMKKWGMEFPRAWSFGIPLGISSGEGSELRKV